MKADEPGAHVEASVTIAAGGVVGTAFLPYHLARMRIEMPSVTLRTALSPGGERFVTPLALRAVTGVPPYTDDVEFEPVSGHPIHLEYASSDLLVLYPASARILASVAAGIVSCPVTRLFAFGRKDRTIVCPSLHPDMSDSIYRRHVELLEQVGTVVVRPDDGLHWTRRHPWVETLATIRHMLAAPAVAESWTGDVVRLLGHDTPAGASPDSAWG